ncbi:hypothetical protein CK203_063423 [Vitis vinifera]|uniref:Uncharacterized protein n=1 Tax=Vitis vinifera TaxID=29760 RepID=A0A438G8F7_VITVI|nr:hypothetical protein CK203_063423 [Vitis vinifera]
MERMDHFQIQQDQQTLILREIQQHLGLVPPAPPVAVPSSVPAEDPPIHQRSLLLDHTITPLPFFVGTPYKRPMCLMKNFASLALKPEQGPRGIW